MSWWATSGCAAASRTWACRCVLRATARRKAKAANYPEIRFFTVVGHSAYRHTDVIGGKWSEVTPQTAEWVSAVAYYFARKVQQDTHVPIGLLLDNVGGTPAEAWTSAEALRPLKDFDVPLAELARLTAAGAPSTATS
jgi:sialate O-acetylesterase